MIYLEDEEYFIWETSREVVDFDAPFWDDGEPADPPNEV